MQNKDSHDQRNAVHIWRTRRGSHCDKKIEDNFFDRGRVLFLFYIANNKVKIRNNYYINKIV